MAHVWPFIKGWEYEGVGLPFVDPLGWDEFINISAPNMVVVIGRVRRDNMTSDPAGMNVPSGKRNSSGAGRCNRNVSMITAIVCGSVNVALNSAMASHSSCTAWMQARCLVSSQSRDVVAKLLIAWLLLSLSRLNWINRLTTAGATFSPIVNCFMLRMIASAKSLVFQCQIAVRIPKSWSLVHSWSLSNAWT
jgi:hypothetical protein